MAKGFLRDVRVSVDSSKFSFFVIAKAFLLFVVCHVKVFESPGRFY